MRNKRRDPDAPIGPVGRSVPLPLPRDAAGQGQVAPLPLPREGEGEAVPLPLPRQGEGTIKTLPLPREDDDAPAPLPRPKPDASEGREHRTGKGHSVTRRVATEILDRAKEHHGRLNNFAAAFRIASREVSGRLYQRDDGVYDLKPPTKLELFVQEWAKGGKAAAPPAEPEDVARLRRAWDEAARSGDPDRMTRAANDLIRAVTDARSRGEMPSARAGESDPTREILNPQRGRSIGEYGHNVHAEPHASSEALQESIVDLGADAGNLSYDPGDTLNKHALGAAGEHLGAAWRNEALHEQTDLDALGSAAASLLPGVPNAEIFGDDGGPTSARPLHPLSTPLSYRERKQYDHDRSGGDIGQDFDDAIEGYFGSGFTVIAADRVPPMGRIALEKVLKRRLTPVEVEALQAIRVLGRRLTRAERAELLSRNVIRGRLAEEATAKFFKAYGFKVWAQNATIVTKAGIRRIDVVVRDRHGRYWAIETKAGGASRNAYQRRVDLEIERNGGVFVGERAGPLDGVRERMGTIVMEIPGI